MKKTDDSAVAEAVKRVLRRYFEVDDAGKRNPEFDEGFSAQDTIDAIHEIVGEV